MVMRQEKLFIMKLLNKELALGIALSLVPTLCFAQQMGYSQNGIVYTVTWLKTDSSIYLEFNIHNGSNHNIYVLDSSIIDSGREDLEDTATRFSVNYNGKLRRWNHHQPVVYKGYEITPGQSYAFSHELYYCKRERCEVDTLFIRFLYLDDLRKKYLAQSKTLHGLYFHASMFHKHGTMVNFITSISPAVFSLPKETEDERC